MNWHFSMDGLIDLKSNPHIYYVNKSLVFFNTSLEEITVFYIKEKNGLLRKSFPITNQVKLIFYPE